MTAALAVVAVGCTEDPGESPGGKEKKSSEEGSKGGSETAGGDTLQQVRDRDELICGVNDVVPGFGSVNDAGEYEGFDIDFCKAVAAAVLGDPEKVSYKPLTAETRLTALAAGEIDVLIRNTTWTVTRDTGGARFVTTTFYDGVGMMVPTDTGFSTIEDMEGAEICVLSGTTTEQVLDATFTERGIEYNPNSFESNEVLQPAFEQGQCDGWVSDKSQLAGVRSAWPEGPEALTVMEETFSKEPLGPVVRDGDDQWAQIVEWVVIATIQAEESDITSENVQEMVNSEDPNVQLLLGTGETDEGDPFDSGLGLEPDWVVTMIGAVGNYGEIYDRNVGPDTGLGLERAINALWTDGGLLYAPPYR